MILCDVSVLLNAYFTGAKHHRVCRDALEHLRSSEQTFAILDHILASVVRIATHPKVFKPPATAAEIFAFLNMLRRDDEIVVLVPGKRHWTIFQDLVEATAVSGSDVTDAWLAAAAMEHGCEWWTTDGGFARFPGLRQRNLLAAPLVP